MRIKLIRGDKHSEDFGFTVDPDKDEELACPTVNISEGDYINQIKWKDISSHILLSSNKTFLFCFFMS